MRIRWPWVKRGEFEERLAAIGVRLANDAMAYQDLKNRIHILEGRPQNASVVKGKFANVMNKKVTKIKRAK